MAKQTLGAMVPVESNPGAGLPAEFLKETAIKTAAPLYESTPYVSFVSSKGAGFARIAAHISDLEEGSPVLILPQPQKPILLDPFKFYLIASKWHYSEVDNNGWLVRSTFDRERAKADKTPRGKPGCLSEHVEAIIFVVLPDQRIIPATITFKTTKVSGVTPAIDAFGVASTPEWGALSPEHKASMGVPDPRFRFLTTCKRKAGVSRSTGNAYVAMNGVVKPTGVADWQAVAAWLRDANNVSLITAVKDRWNKRLDEVAGKGF